MAKEWSTLEFSLEPLLEPIYPVLEGIDGILSALITILNIVQKILDVIKVFLIGLLDPIRALIELIIEEIRAIIRDLRQIGLYYAGDIEIIDPKNNFADIIGGYSAYEQRMVARLLDTTDPNRPNFSGSSVAFGVFLYASSGDISVIFRAIKAILNLLGRGDLLGKNSPYPTPTAPAIGYGTEAAGVAAFKSLGKTFSSSVPDSISVTWSMPTGTSKNPFRNPSPKGFLLHVSTIPDGLEVVSMTSNPTSANPNEPPRIVGGAVDPITNGPLKLYGGVADIGVSSNPKDYSSVEALTSAQAPLLLLKKDQVTPLIKPSTLVPSSGPPLLGNTYYVKMSDLSPQRIGGGTKYTATIKIENLPLNASFEGGDDGFAKVVSGSEGVASNYWVRVRALTTNYVNFAKNNSLSGSLLSPGSVYDTNLRLFQFSNSGIKGAATSNGVILPEATGTTGTPESSLSFKDITTAGSPGVVTIPSEKQLAYQQAVQAALALAILCRADLTEFTENNYKNVYATGYALGFEGKVRNLLGTLQISTDFFYGSRPQVFRNKLKSLILNFRPNSPPEDVIDTILTECSNLLEFVWSDIDDSYPGLTILESIGIGASPSEREGVGANPFCRTIPISVLQLKYAEVGLLGGEGGPERTPSFVLSPKAAQAETWIYGGGSADSSPILYQDSNQYPNAKVRFIRNAVYEYDNQTLLKQASRIFSVATATYSLPDEDGGWRTVRLMPQALVPLDQLLTKVDRFLQGVLDGLQGIIDQIIRYIEAIQARIYQLQALIELIRSLLRSISLFQLPQLSGLVLVEAGTAGLLTGLITSENKPVDDANDYGAGIVLVAGGIPTVLLETLALLFAGSGEE